MNSVSNKMNPLPQDSCKSALRGILEVSRDQNIKQEAVIARLANILDSLRGTQSEVEAAGVVESINNMGSIPNLGEANTHHAILNDHLAGIVDELEGLLF